MADAAPQGNPFLKFFVPGLVLGLIVGAVAGAFLGGLSGLSAAADGPKPSEIRTGGPRNVERGAEPEPTPDPAQTAPADGKTDGTPAEPKADETKPAETKPAETNPAETKPAQTPPK
jgi:hypothetical protein